MSIIPVIPLGFMEAQDLRVWKNYVQVINQHADRLEEYAKLRRQATVADWAELARRQAEERRHYAVALGDIEGMVAERLRRTP